MRLTFLFRVIFFLSIARTLQAQTPPLINYQGRIVTGSTNFDGTGFFKFALVNENGSQSFWSNDRTSANGSEPATPISLTVIKGLYSVLLGDSSLPAPMRTIGASDLAHPDVRLRVWFSTAAGGPFELLSPDQRLAPSAYLADGAVRFNNIAASDPIAGQVLGFNGSGFSWVAPGGGGGAGNYWALNGASIYYNSGNVGIGTATPAHLLSISGGPGWTSSGWLGSLALANASAIGWGTNAAGQRFGMGHSAGGFYMFRTSSNPGTTGSSAVYDFVVSDSGNIGIGSLAPVGKLEVVAQDALRLTGFQPFLTLFDSNAGNARGRIQSVAGNLTLETESFVSGSNANSYAALATNGNFSVKSLTIRGGADLAEPFAMSQRGVPQGAVVTIDPRHPGKLKMSAKAYDKKVAGIVSGANGINPGISMIDEQQLEAGENVALSGRVYVKANTSSGKVEPGDVLTTSDVPGEAMKAANHTRAQGSILGKAMTTIDETSGMVLVLVTLQ